MPIEKHQFHKSEQGMGNEDWYLLIRDTDSGEMHVLHEWSHKTKDLKFQSGEEQISIDEFVKVGGTRQQRLLALLSDKGWD